VVVFVVANAASISIRHQTKPRIAMKSKANNEAGKKTRRTDTDKHEAPRSPKVEKGDVAVVVEDAVVARHAVLSQRSRVSTKCTASAEIDSTAANECAANEDNRQQQQNKRSYHAILDRSKPRRR
jgi:hypothetical protein